MKCTCGCLAKFQLSLNWKQGEVLNVCFAHAPIWIKSSLLIQGGDKSPGGFYTLVKIFA